MAIIDTPNRMVFWKIFVYDTDMTTLLAPYVSSISIKHSVMPPSTREGKESFPYEATISFITKDYVENIFIPGCPVKIYLGYGKIHKILTENDLVFKGEMINYPDGEAQEMLKYVVKAYGYGDTGMLMTEKNRTFLGKTKSQIIREILAPYNYNVIVSISKDNVIPGKYSPGQSMDTDLTILQRLAKEWGCLCWYVFPNTFYFTDADIAHSYRDTYILGYRTDKVKKCNVESVKWKHNPERAAEEFNSGVQGLNEDGVIIDPDVWKIPYAGRTWKLQAKYAKKLDKKNPDWGEWARKYGEISNKYIFTWQGLMALKTFYIPIDDDEANRPRDPAHDDTGWDITVTLNEGDPNLKIPCNAALYYGSINPRADSSNLPFYIHYYSNPIVPFIQLKVNETTLSYDNGKLNSELKCTIGRFA